MLVADPVHFVVYVHPGVVLLDKLLADLFVSERYVENAVGILQAIELLNGKMLTVGMPLHAGDVVIPLVAG